MYSVVVYVKDVEVIRFSHLSLIRAQRICESFGGLSGDGKFAVIYPE